MNIFVFGSNEAGRHGKGAAKYAQENFGAIYGQGWGLQGQSFGIPTKDGKLNVLPLGKIYHYIQSFLEFAKASPNNTYNVTPIGCGLAGYGYEDIAVFFSPYSDLPKNVILPKEFLQFKEFRN